METTREIRNRKKRERIVWVRENDAEKYKHNNEKKKEWRRNNKDKKRQHKNRWTKANPEKIRAQTILNNSVRDKRIEKPSLCSSCNISNVTIEGHHGDYTKPLEVIWLCTHCHKKLHRDLKSI